MEIAVKFPSPTGSSYFSMLCGVTRTLRMSSFPSPTGSSYFSMIRLVNIFNNDRMTVSVPYGVFVFLNLLRAQGHDLRSCGFRPLRGLRISQFGAKTKYKKMLEAFPSPAGSSYFSMCTGVYCYPHAIGFRPLRGLRISQLNTCGWVLQSFKTVSVPCGVFVFLNHIHGAFIVNIRRLFPSPAGSSYFSMHKPHLLAAEFVGVSVPCGVFVFLNHTAQASS